MKYRRLELSGDKQTPRQTPPSKLCATHDEGFALAPKAIQFRLTVLSLGAYIINAVSAGHLDQAREAVTKVLGIAPDLRVSKIFEVLSLRDGNLADKLISCLRDAGLPE